MYRFRLSRKYKLLTAEVQEKKKAVKAKLADSEAVLRSARQDAIRIRDAARKEAAEYVVDAQREVDALYAEYESSKAGRKKKDDIKLKLLAERYPEINDHLDSAAGHAVLRGRWPTDRGNARAR